MELRGQAIEGELLDPDNGFAPARIRLEQRWDPLTGHSSRLVSSPDQLFPPNTYDLARLANQTRTGCPFCPDLIETVTPRFAPSIWPEGRIRRGHALLFPNLRAYAKHTSVAVYGPDLHYLPLERLDARLVGDNLQAQVDFARAALAADPTAAWVSINANHMLPSGSSLFHPHTQGAAHPQPSTMQALLATLPAERFTDYLATERRQGHRHLGSTGTIQWLASFAPIGPAELRAFLPGVASPAELPGDRVAELAHGIAIALGLYADLGFESFNLALYGAPPGTAGYPLNLRMLARSNLDTPYRSDATFMERLHWEAALDLTITPETVADRAADRFRR